MYNGIACLLVDQYMQYVSRSPILCNGIAHLLVSTCSMYLPFIVHPITIYLKDYRGCMDLRLQFGERLQRGRETHFESLPSNTNSFSPDDSNMVHVITHNLDHGISLAGCL